MSCQGKRRRLVALVHGELSPGAAKRLREHLDGCAACKDALARLQQARQALAAVSSAPLPEINDRQVEAQIRWRLARRSAPRRDVRIGRGLAVAALAAALCAGGVVGALLHRGLVPARGRAVDAKSIVQRPAPVAAAPEARVPREQAELAALPTLLAGDVLVADGDGRVGPLRIDRPLLQGERVITQGGEVALQWDTRRGLRLQPNSEIRLTRLDGQGQQVELLRGRVDVEIGKRGAPFAVVGGGVRAAVKGTCFAVGLGGHETTVRVYRGLVAVSPVTRDARAGARPVDVAAGRMLRAVAGSAPAIVALESSDRPPAFNLQHPWPSIPHLLAMTGSLRVESKPAGAEVRIDAEPLGKTNLTARGSVGRHLVELWRGDELLNRQWVHVSGAALAHVTVKLNRPPRTQRLPPALYEVFRRRAVLIRGCYERQLKRTADLAGRLVVRVVIDDSGRVTEATLDSDTLPDAQVGRCALAAVREWRFPAGQAAEIIYPFLFRPN